MTDLETAEGVMMHLYRTDPEFRDRVRNEVSLARGKAEASAVMIHAGETKVIAYMTDQAKTDLLYSGHVSCLTEDMTGDLWIMRPQDHEALEAQVVADADATKGFVSDLIATFKAKATADLEAQLSVLKSRLGSMGAAA